MEEHNALTQSKTAVRIQLARLGINQADLARQIGVLPGTVSRALAGSPIDERSKTWPAMLDALGLEVVIRPKESSGAAEIDPAETAAVLADHPEIVERAQRLKAGTSKLIPWQDVKAELNL